MGGAVKSLERAREYLKIPAYRRRRRLLTALASASVSSSSFDPPRLISSSSSPCPVRPEMEWKDVENALLAEMGWEHRRGDGLVDYYYVTPLLADFTKAEMKRLGIRGVDYFAGVDDLRDYCRGEFGWVGPDGERDGTDDEDEEDRDGSGDVENGEDALPCSLRRPGAVTSPKTVTSTTDGALHSPSSLVASKASSSPPSPPSQNEGGDSIASPSSSSSSEVVRG